MCVVALPAHTRPTSYLLALSVADHTSIHMEYHCGAYHYSWRCPISRRNWLAVFTGLLLVTATLPVGGEGWACGVGALGTIAIVLQWRRAECHCPPATLLQIEILPKSTDQT
jgi:hypothetical protein